MTKKQNAALLEAIEDFSTNCFNFLGKKKAQNWAIKTANEGFVYEALTPDEKFFYSCFHLSKTCHKIKVIITESEDLFHVQQS